MIQYIKKAVLIVIAIIASIGIQLNINMDICIWNRFSGNYMISLILCFFIFEALEKVSKLKDKRVHFFAGIIALVFSVIEVLGFYLENYNQLHFVKVSIIKGIAYYICFYIAITILFSKIKKNANKAERVHREAKSQKNIKLFFGSWGVIFICWIPYFIKYFPGIMTPDSILQAGQAIAYGLNSHHPMFHTLIIKLALNIGNIIKDYNMGVAIYSIMQMLIMSSIFAYAITYIDSRQTSKVFSILSLVYFAIYPVFGVYSITMWKDILFSGIMPLFIIQNIELIFNTEEFLGKKRNMVAYVIIAIFTILLRHNGLYVVMLSLPFTFVVLRKHWKKVLIMFLSILVIYEAFNFVVFKILKVKKGSVGEMLSVPIQQIVRSVKNNYEDIDEETINKINEYFTVENAWEYYNPVLSDPVKFKFNNGYFEENKSEFISIWLKLFVKYPKDYIEAFISNSYGYYYPEARNSIVSRATMDHNMGIKQTPLIEGKWVEQIDSLTDVRDIPAFSFAFSIGAGFMLTVIALSYIIYKKKYKYILVYLPTFILWLTLIASPAYCEFRYAYPIFLALPVYIGMNFVKEGNNENGKNSSTNTLL